jgi:serine/threonine-protein kinase
MEQLGEYLLHRTIGEGGMGRVYRAEERLSGRAVALKMLRPEWAAIPRVRQLFINEMEILARLEHPNIVRSLASIEVEDQLAVALELVEGASLRDLLDERGALSVDEAIHVVACVAKALSAAHDHQPPVIHRDLKPDNVMVSVTGAVKVMDFGIAKVLERANQTNTRNVGTLLYMSPEQIDARTIDHRSDLYSLGLLFYELLTGATPFCADSPRELLNLQCTGQPTPLPPEVEQELPSDVRELLFTLLDKAPERRPQSALCVLERLGERVSTSRPPASRRTLSDTEPMGEAEVPPTLPPTTPRAPSNRSWHASRARDAWLARFEGLDDATKPPSATTTVPQPPLVARTTKSGEIELSTRASMLIIGALMVTAALVTYALRML